MEDAMLNTHTRVLRASPEAIARFIESAWSGTADDPFPRDVIATWRKNPTGVAPLALVPTLTSIGHGPFRFRFESWDGRRWRVRVNQDGYRGWHGFELEAIEGGTRLTHRIELALTGSARVLWPLVIAPIHDWAVEALFDRLQAALETGAVPARTTRRMSVRAALTLRALRALPPVSRPREVHELPGATLRDMFLARYLGER
jgi:hypothetical protein